MLANAVHNACVFTQRGKIVLHVTPLQSGRMYILFEVIFTGLQCGLLSLVWCEEGLHSLNLPCRASKGLRPQTVPIPQRQHDPVRIHTVAGSGHHR
jgi:hypothetical protein